MTSHDKFVSALLKYDTQQSRKVGYNVYALPQYLNRLQDVEKDIANGAEIRAALVNGFCGPLLDRLLKIANLPISTHEENFRYGGFTRLTHDNYAELMDIHELK